MDVIRQAVLLLGMTFMVASASAQSVPDQHAPGDWQGLLDTGSGKLTIIVSIFEDETNGLSGVLETPDQAPGIKIPLTSIGESDNNLTFSIQRLGVTYEAAWSIADDQWIGTWKQSGLELPLTLMPGLPPDKPTIEGLDGVWEGVVTRNDRVLRLVFRVETRGSGTNAHFDAPDFGLKDLPVAGLTRTGTIVKFTVPAIGANYEGQLASDQYRMTGTWQFPNQPDAEVVFTRTKKTVQRPSSKDRPQTPTGSIDYRIEDVLIENPVADSVTLAGTLTSPRGKGPFPAAVLITGSGPQDRDESIYGHKPFAVLADHLTRNGVVVVRYDDRGVGASTGNFGSATSADFATDANAVVQFLLTRPEVDRAAIGLIGHSEGGVVAPLAAVDNADIDFIVMLAGPGTSLREIDLAQRRIIGSMAGMSEQVIARREPVFEEIYSAVASTGSKRERSEAVRAILTPANLTVLGIEDSQADFAVQSFTRDWFQFLLRYDPVSVLSRVHVPVLALNGSLDVQVPADANLSGIKSAMIDNPDVTIREIENLNHMFQTTKTGSIGDYEQIAETFAPVALNAISEWIKERFVQKQGV